MINLNGWSSSPPAPALHRDWSGQCCATFPGNRYRMTEGKKASPAHSSYQNGDVPWPKTQKLPSSPQRPKPIHRTRTSHLRPNGRTTASRSVERLPRQTNGASRRRASGSFLFEADRRFVLAVRFASEMVRDHPHACLGRGRFRVAVTDSDRLILLMIRVLGVDAPAVLGS